MPEPKVRAGGRGAMAHPRLIAAAPQTNITSDGFRSLREGEAVEFEVEAGPDGRSKAVNVSGPDGAAPEVCRRTQAAAHQQPRAATPPSHWP